MNDDMLISMKSLQASYNMINLVDRIKALGDSMPVGTSEFTKEFDEVMTLVRQRDILECLPQEVAIAELVDSINISLSLPRKKWLKILDDAKCMPDVKTRGIQLEIDLESAIKQNIGLNSTLDRFHKEMSELKKTIVLLSKGK